MGFYSTLISESYGLVLPEWFMEKYPYIVSNDNKLSIAILKEIKFYRDIKDTDLFIDIQKLMIEQSFNTTAIVLVLLHECGGITRIQISATDIKASEPIGWQEVDRVEHDYCYGCSDVNFAFPKKQ